GKIRAPGSYVADPSTGTAVFITKGVYILDADARQILFSHHQVPPEGVLDKDLDMNIDMIKLENRLSRAGPPMYALTHIVGATDWTPDWERTFKMNASFGRLHVEQRLSVLTPRWVRVDARKYNWASFYLTSELGPETVRSLLDSCPELKAKSAREDPAWRFRVYQFLLQAGWYDHADQELTAILKDLPGEKEKIEAARANLRKMRTAQL